MIKKFIQVNVGKYIYLLANKASALRPKDVILQFYNNSKINDTDNETPREAFSLYDNKKSRIAIDKYWQRVFPINSIQ